MVRTPLRIADVIEVDDLGVVAIVVHPSFDRMSLDEIRAAFDGEIDGLLEVKTSTSLLGQKNVYLVFPADCDRTVVRAGATVNADL